MASRQTFQVWWAADQILALGPCGQGQRQYLTFNQFFTESFVDINIGRAAESGRLWLIFLAAMALEDELELYKHPARHQWILLDWWMVGEF